MSDSSFILVTVPWQGFHRQEAGELPGPWGVVHKCGYVCMSVSTGNVHVYVVGVHWGVYAHGVWVCISTWAHDVHACTHTCAWYVHVYML